MAGNTTSKQKNGGRGPYSKGVVARAAILDSALELCASSGRRPTLKQIAQASKLSEAGVLHYFGSMDALLIAVLERRDEKAMETYKLTTIDEAFEYLETTTREPGLTRLYVEMNIAAQDPAHPASQFVTHHREETVKLIAGLLTTPAPERDARALVAAAEGLQLMWLIDRETDIAGELRYLYGRIASDPLPAREE